MTEHGDSPEHQQGGQDSRNEKDAAIDRLIRQANHYLRLLHITHEAIVSADERGRIVIFNQGAEKLFGYKQEEILGQPLDRLLCTHFRAEEQRRLTTLVRIARENKLGFQADHIICQNKNGSRIPCDISLSQTILPELRLYTLVVHNATRRLQHERELAYQAEHDNLTDLPNRLLLNERLNAGIARAERYGRRLGVVYLDLDDFKPINDRYGHETGDFLLREVANRLRDTMRQSDTVSRIGGDEFIVCVEHINNAKDAMAAAEKIVGALNCPFHIEGHHIHTTASIGIALYPDHGQDPGTLLRNADQAMYNAKSQSDGPRLFVSGAAN